MKKLVWESGWMGLILLLLVRAGVSQVNTERLRKSELTTGFNNSLNFDLAFVSGNSEFLKLKTGMRVDYQAKKYYSFGVIQYQRGLQKSRVFINKGFVHLRGVRIINKRFSGEVFFQKEFNDFILLKDRNLIGAGWRTALISQQNDGKNYQWFIGNGAMWENEQINTSPITETKIVRSTNYISLLFQKEKQWRANFVSYYQFNVKHWQDYRVLIESSFGFNLTRSLMFRTNFNLRYDNEPPPKIKNYDLEMTNGFSFSF